MTAANAEIFACPLCDARLTLNSPATALADVILVSSAHVHSADDIADVIRNLVSAVRDQVVEEMQYILGGK